MIIIFQEERLVLILEHLKVTRTMSVGEICNLYHVSRDTARRDIVKLVEQGAATRTHGGIALPDLQNTILAYRDRMQNYSGEKMRIGARTLPLLNPRGEYFLNASTTVSCMAKQLSDEMTVYTHSLDTAEVLAEHATIEVFLLGGILNTANRYFFDMKSVNQLEAIRFDGAFLGVAGIAADGFYYDDRDDAYMNGTAASRSGQTVVLADHLKFSKKSRYKGLDWSDVDIVITDAEVPAAFLALARSKDTEIIVAEKPLHSDSSAYKEGE
ncbi:DeoR/GlpR family DNA-binding transcription regulator [Sporolactobacillus pectinivorans]|uniref:DeoR/GlpR family DNA-binding transcription regulator n=1 Tax=Sporolactobacillus pectinivorans TaxID=1591408 RepID=UPI001EFEE9D2|nr:DeoR/GlpR family DNA-binding transcription regulator [Sporolactobacillus pectinivorans]